MVLPQGASIAGAVIVNSSGDEQVSEAGRAEVIALAQLIPKRFDYVDMTYAGDNMTRVIYKLGGAAGVQQGQIDMTYSGDNMLTLTRI